MRQVLTGALIGAGLVLLYFPLHSWIGYWAFATLVVLFPVVFLVAYIAADLISAIFGLNPHISVEGQEVC